MANNVKLHHVKFAIGDQEYCSKPMSKTRALTQKALLLTYYGIHAHLFSIEEDNENDYMAYKEAKKVLKNEKDRFLKILSAMNKVEEHEKEQAIKEGFDTFLGQVSKEEFFAYLPDAPIKKVGNATYCKKEDYEKAFGWIEERKHNDN